MFATAWPRVRTTGPAVWRPSRAQLPQYIASENKTRGPQHARCVSSQQHRILSATETLRRKSPAQTPTNPDILRQLMRSVPHPVAVVTASPKAESGAGTSANPRHWRGATVSSFVTVTMDPDPIVCFNIKHDSSTFAALASSSRFNIHVLGSNSLAQDVATKFAGGNALEPFHDGEGLLEWWAAESSPLADDHPNIAMGSNKIEAAAKDEHIVLFRLKCAHLDGKTVKIGDHVVVFGKVVGVDKRAGHDELDPCLLYVNGRYSQASER